MKYAAPKVHPEDQDHFNRPIESQETFLWHPFPLSFIYVTVH